MLSSSIKNPLQIHNICGLSSGKYNVFDLDYRGGFTLIELIVVMALLSIFIFFTIPQFDDSLLTDNTRKMSRWIIIKIPALKEKAVTEQKHYTLHVDIDGNRFWISNETMSEEELIHAEKTGYSLIDDMNILNVEFPGDETVSTGQAMIHFYKQGYSDMAVIRMEDSENQFSFKIEPFLSGVTKYENNANING